jgi:S1-C subfamily serine protease
MALRIVCPSCETTLTLSDDKRGKKIACRECQTILSIPAAKKQTSTALQEAGRGKVKAKTALARSRDDDDDAPPVKRKAKTKKGSSLGLILGGVAAVLLLLMIGTATGGYFLWKAYFPAERQIAKVIEVPEPEENPTRERKETRPEPVVEKKETKPEPIVEKKETKPEPVITKPEPIVEKKPDPTPIVTKPDPTPPPSTPEIATAVAKRVKAATVFLKVTLPKNQVVTGSGFFMMGSGVIVTNAHLMGMQDAASAPPLRIDVIMNDKSKATAQVRNIDGDNNLALLSINGGVNLPPPLQMESVNTLAEAQPIFISGYATGDQDGKNIKISNASIAKLSMQGTQRQIQVSGGMNQGNTGGPIINADGNVVAVALDGSKNSNLAIPVELVKNLAAARLTNTTVGTPYAKNGQNLLPITCNYVDPLNQIKSLRVQVWTGKEDPGKSRPASTDQPQPVPGDSQRLTVKIPYQGGTGKVEVVMPAIPAGQVCWVQPALATASATAWGPAASVASPQVIVTGPPVVVPPPPPVKNTKPLLQKAENLTTADPADPTQLNPMQLKTKKTHMKLFPLNLTAGKTYLITVQSNAFHPYIRLETINGAPVAQANGANAHITQRIGVTGLYRVAVATHSAKVGPFQITVTEQP